MKNYLELSKKIEVAEKAFDVLVDSLDSVRALLVEECNRLNLDTTKLFNAETNTLSLFQEIAQIQANAIQLKARLENARDDIHDQHNEDVIEEDLAWLAEEEEVAEEIKNVDAILYAKRTFKKGEKVFWLRTVDVSLGERERVVEVVEVVDRVEELWLVVGREHDSSEWISADRKNLFHPDRDMLALAAEIFSWRRHYTDAQISKLCKQVLKLREFSLTNAQKEAYTWALAELKYQDQNEFELLTRYINIKNTSNSEINFFIEFGLTHNIEILKVLEHLLNFRFAFYNDERVARGEISEQKANGMNMTASLAIQHVATLHNLSIEDIRR